MKESYLQILHNSKHPKVKGHAPLPQQRALQLLFDCRFVLQIFPRKEDMNFVADLLWLFHSFYLRRSSVESFVERDFFIRILFQVYFDFA
jgi:hypothetical protein